MIEAPRRVEKPWGYELIWAETEHYVGKILHIAAGEALSLQYHEVKDETLYLLHGRFTLEFGPSRGELTSVEMTEGQSFRILSNTLHRVSAFTDVDILEASTPHLDDVVRLDDRYGRVAPSTEGL